MGTTPEEQAEQRTKRLSDVRHWVSNEQAYQDPDQVAKYFWDGDTGRGRSHPNVKPLRHLPVEIDTKHWWMSGEYELFSGRDEHHPQAQRKHFGLFDDMMEENEDDDDGIYFWKHFDRFLFIRRIVFRILDLMTVVDFVFKFVI